MRVLNLGLKMMTILHAAFIGHEKHMLDHVELSLPLVAVVSSFGKYLQYKVETPDSIISAACHNEEISLSFIEPVTERNKRDALSNKIVSFFSSSSLRLLEA